MKTIEIITLEIQNFKSIDNLTIDFSKDLELHGANGTGKTSIADAIWWVLFGKDSQGRAKFGIRPHDKDNNDIHNIAIDVKLTLSVDGEVIIFGRKSEEKWTTQRGSNDKVLTGNETTLTVNDSIVKTKEYAQELDKVLAEDDFKLLSNPMHFMNGLDDKQRREVLMTLAGNEVEIEDNLKSQSKYVNLVKEWSSEMNKNKSFVMFFEYLKSKSKTDNETLRSIPEQIHALESTLQDYGSKEDLENLIKGYQNEINKIDKGLNKDVEEPHWVLETLASVSDMRNDIEVLEEDDRKAHSDRQREYIAKTEAHNVKLQTNKRDMDNLDYELQNKEISLKEAESYKNDLLEKYHTIKSGEFHAPEVETVCYACKQDLKDVNKDEVIAHAKTHFEEQKDKTLAQIILDGKAQSETALKLTQEVEAMRLTIDSMKRERERLEHEASLVGAVAKNVANPQIKELQDKITEFASKVKDFRSTHTVDNSDLIQSKNSYMAMIGDAQRKSGMIEQQETTKNKVQELLDTEEKLRKTKIHFEVLINDALEFENEKNKSFESNLSKHFNNIEWKLFANQINGGYRNVCYPILKSKGTAYADQSTGEKIYTGVDIIKTFQSVKQTEVPIFIDNKESLSLQLDLSNQVISMYVDKTLEKLTIVK